MLHINFKVIGLLVTEKNFSCFYHIYWAKVLTDHPKNCDNVLVVHYFGMNFGTFNENSLASIVLISWNLAFCMQFTHTYTHNTFKMHVQLEK